MKTNTLTLKCGPGSCPIHEADLERFVGKQAIIDGKKRFDMETIMPWGYLVSLRGLAVTATWSNNVHTGHRNLETHTLHGDRQLSHPVEAGYQLEGTCSVNGKNMRAFTSTVMFEVIETKKLVSILN